MKHQPVRQGQTTTPGTTFPTLFDEWVGSLTSPANHITMKIQETRPSMVTNVVGHNDHQILFNKDCKLRVPKYMNAQMYVLSGLFTVYSFVYIAKHYLSISSDTGSCACTHNYMHCTVEVSVYHLKKDLRVQGLYIKIQLYLVGHQ